MSLGEFTVRDKAGHALTVHSNRSVSLHVRGLCQHYDAKLGDLDLAQEALLRLAALVKEARKRLRKEGD